MNLLRLTTLFLLCVTTVYASDEPILNINPLPAYCKQGNAIVFEIPYAATDTPSILNHGINIFDATGTLVASDIVSYATATHDGGQSMRCTYTPDNPGSLILSVTHSTWASLKIFPSIVEPAGIVRESTMYYLSTSILRSPTTSWTVSSPIIRSSSAGYESALWETLTDDRDQTRRQHVVIYDQSTENVNYIQRGLHYWVDTATQALQIMERAVPDGDLDRYEVQE